MSEAVEGKLTHSQVAIFDELDRMAQPHIDRSNGRFVLLPRDISQLGPHLDTADPPLLQNPAYLEQYGENMDPRYPAVQRSIDVLAGRRSDDVLPLVDYHLLRGDNVCVVTNHGEIIDIGLLFAGLGNTMAKKGYAAIAERKVRHGMIISKIVNRVGVVPPQNPDDPDGPAGPAVPATTALQSFCHDVWSSYPDTLTLVRMRGLLPGHTKANNKEMLGSLSKTLDKGSLFWAIAASGTEDKPLPGSPDIIQLARLGDRTIEMMAHERTYVLPAAIWLKNGNPIVEFVDIPRKIKTTDQAHGTMTQIADMLTQIVPDQRFAYEPARALGASATKKIVPRDY